MVSKKQMNNNRQQKTLTRRIIIIGMFVWAAIIVAVAVRSAADMEGSLAVIGIIEFVFMGICPCAALIEVFYPSNTGFGSFIMIMGIIFGSILLIGFPMIYLIMKVEQDNPAAVAILVMAGVAIGLIILMLLNGYREQRRSQGHTFDEFLLIMENEQIPDSRPDNIKESEWECIFNTESSDFEDEFNSLIQRHINHAEYKISRMKDGDDKWRQIKELASYKKMLKYGKWLNSLPVNTKIAVSYYAKKEQDAERLIAFMCFVDEIGLLKSAERTFSKSSIVEMSGGRCKNIQNVFCECFERLSEIQENKH